MHHTRVAAILAAILVAPPPFAQAATSTAYRSPFADYVPYQDVPLGDWRSVNRQITRVPPQPAASTAAPDRAANAGRPATPSTRPATGDNVRTHGGHVHEGQR